LNQKTDVVNIRRVIKVSKFVKNIYLIFLFIHIVYHTDETTRLTRIFSGIPSYDRIRPKPVVFNRP